MTIKKTKGDRIREYLVKHPKQTNKKIADKLKTVPSYVHKVRKESYFDKSGPLTRAQLSKELEPTLNALFGAQDETVQVSNYVGNTRASVLENAKQLVNKDRAEIYGDSKTNHDRIAKLWSVILDKEITYQQVIMCMTALKLARLIQTPDHTDTWTDICGYGALGGEDD